MPATPTESAGKRNAVEAFLRIFTEVRSGEGPTAGLMALNIFFLLGSYYLLKPAREALISLEPRGAELASYAAAAMAVLLIPTVMVYGWLGRRFARRNLIAAVLGVFILNLAAFYGLAQARVPYVGFAFFIWVGIFNNMVVAQFWSFGNDIYGVEQGKRLFPLILVGQTLGAIAGPLAAGWAARAASAETLMLPAAGLIAGSIGLTFWIDRRVGPGNRKSTSREAKLGAPGGFELIWKTRYLWFVAGLILVLNLVNTTGEYILRDRVFDAAAGRADRSSFVAGFYADFYFWVNVLTTVVQAVVVSRILKFAGVRVALFILPTIALAGYGMIAAAPVLFLARIAKTAENAFDYSLMNTLRAALYLPTSREIKYKAKQAIDTFVVRIGDLLSAGAVALGIHALGLGTRGFALMTLGFVAVWFLLAAGIAREYGKLTGSGEDA